MKLSTETLLEEVQSIVMETNELRSQEEPHQKQVLDFSANRVSSELKNNDSHIEKDWIYKSCQLTFSWKNAAIAFRKK